MMSINDRKSGLELLKIIGLFFIIMMHISGNMYNNVNLLTFNKVFFAVLNAIGNTAVSCFMLITGYFGLRIKKDKVLTLWLLIFLSSVLTGVINFFYFKVSIIEFIRSFFPILMCKSWYFTCYFIILSLSSFIQKFIDSLNQKQYTVLIIILLLWFSFFPTFFYYNITNDKGKGIFNLILIYLIGRYINKYVDINKINTKKMSLLVVVCVLIISIFNLSSTLILKRFLNFFAYDNSIFIIIESIALFFIFYKYKFNSLIINKIAKVTPVTFFIEPTLTKFILSFIDIDNIVNRLYLPICVILLSLIEIIISLLLLFIFQKISLIPFNILTNLIDKVIFKIRYFYNFITNKFVHIFYES